MPKAKETPSTEVIETASGNDLTAKKPKFSRKVAVTVPTRELPDNSTIFCTILEPMDTKPKLDPKTGEQVKDENGELAFITVAKIVDLENIVQEGEPEQPMALVVGKVLKSNLEEHYPENGYVGKSFEITKTKVEKKRYRNYTIFEIEVE